MRLSRRSLLHYTAAGCALTLVPPVLNAAATLLRCYRVQDSVALPRFRPGDLVLADTAVNRFADTGLYLYPAWGQPRLYEIAAGAAGLEFRNPASHELLWTQSVELASMFAGKVLEGPQATGLPAEFPALSVSALPNPA